MGTLKMKAESSSVVSNLGRLAYMWHEFNIRHQAVSMSLASATL